MAENIPNLKIDWKLFQKLQMLTTQGNSFIFAFGGMLIL